jgi:hypothetical protein
VEERAHTQGLRKARPRKRVRRVGEHPKQGALRGSRPTQRMAVARSAPEAAVNRSTGNMLRLASLSRRTEGSTGRPRSSSRRPAVLSAVGESSGLAHSQPAPRGNGKAARFVSRHPGRVPRSQLEHLSVQEGVVGPYFRRQAWHIN